jgi:hypothetical protein
LYFISLRVWFGLVWFGLVWFGLVWFGLVLVCLVWFCFISLHNSFNLATHFILFDDTDLQVALAARLLWRPLRLACCAGVQSKARAHTIVCAPRPQ